MKSEKPLNFLPYQIRWLNDDSKIKIWEKSRRIGATYVQSYEDVRDCVMKKVPAVWFSSADQSAAKEYIDYCEKWTKLFDLAAKPLGEVVIDSDKNVKAYVIEFANKTKIHALSSNPKAFRSKGGKIVLDEFAHHDNQDDLWAAARPCITWNFPLRILSTHNGQNSRFYKFIDDVKKGDLNWNLHNTSIQVAVDEGLVDKILGKNTTKEDRQLWLDEQRSNCFDESTWLQEYCCVAVDESTAFLTYELIRSCERDNLLKTPEDTTGDIFVGMDIGRKKDLSVIWVIERLGLVNYTRAVIELEKTPFKQQEEILYEILKHKNFRRCCIDSTGLGMQLAENAQSRFGTYRVEGINFTAKVKEDLAYNLRRHFEDRAVYITPEHKIREDLHSVRKITTTAGNIRFDVSASEASGHADRFWALALALHSFQTNKPPIYIATRCRREAYDMIKGF